MQNNTFTPIKMLPFLKETIWGGSKLKKFYGKESNELSNIAESWELSAIPGCCSYAENGVFAKKDMNLIYKHFNSGKTCPVLIKFIDSEDDLSIQVHPHKKAPDEDPKNECWYIISAEEGARIAYGFSDGIDGISPDGETIDKSIEEKLNYVSVSEGDMFYVPAGLVHAIGKGITLLEIQQSSDTTYRFYDYDRVGADGKKRELHVKKALRCLKHFSSDEIDSLRFSRSDARPECIVSCDYFSVYKISADRDCTDITSNTNCSVTFLSEGSITSGDTVLKAAKGESFYIPPSSVKTVITSSHAILTAF